MAETSPQPNVGTDEEKERTRRVIAKRQTLVNRGAAFPATQSLHREELSGGLSVIPDGPPPGYLCRYPTEDALHR